MEVSLMDILNARDARAQRQRELLDRFGKPLICFTMNISGPEKAGTGKATWAMVVLKLPCT